jgi:hypothetical protein
MSAFSHIYQSLCRNFVKQGTERRPWSLGAFREVDVKIHNFVNEASVKKPGDVTHFKLISKFGLCIQQLVFAQPV